MATFISAELRPDLFERLNAQPTDMEESIRVFVDRLRKGKDTSDKPCKEKESSDKDKESSDKDKESSDNLLIVHGSIERVENFLGPIL